MIREKFTGVDHTMVLLMPEVIVDMFLEKKDQHASDIILIFWALVWPAFLFNDSNMVISAYFTAMHKPLQSAGIAIPFAEFFTFLMALLFLRAATPGKIISRQ